MGKAILILGGLDPTSRGAGNPDWAAIVSEGGSAWEVQVEGAQVSSEGNPELAESDASERIHLCTLNRRPRGLLEAMERPLQLSTSLVCLSAISLVCRQYVSHFLSTSLVRQPFP